MSGLTYVTDKTRIYADEIKEAADEFNKELAKISDRAKEMYDLISGSTTVEPPWEKLLGDIGGDTISTENGGYGGDDYWNRVADEDKKLSAEWDSENDKFERSYEKWLKEVKEEREEEESWEESPEESASKCLFPNLGWLHMRHSKGDIGGNNSTSTHLRGVKPLFYVAAGFSLWMKSG